MPEFFALNGGAVRGKTHVYRHANCQDAYAIAPGNNPIFATSAVVCDGCGSGQFSELGARLGCQTIAHLVSSRIGYDCCEEDYTKTLDLTKQKILRKITLLSKCMGLDTAQKIIDNFLFTVVGVAINDIHAVFYSFGDGYFFINGEQIELGPFPGNAPPYLAYNIIRPENYSDNLLHFKIERIVPIAELQHFMIATDGLSYLLEASHKPLPAFSGNRDETIRLPSQFWEEEKYTRINQTTGEVNHSLISRRLNLINGGIPKHVVSDGENNKVIETLQVGLGSLDDDLALVVGKRVIWEK